MSDLIYIHSIISYLSTLTLKEKGKRNIYTNSLGLSPRLTFR